MRTSDRFVSFMVAATFAYLGVEYLIQKRERFAAWRAEFTAPFEKHPGRREFLRDLLTREEMTIKERKPVAVDANCGCDDA